VAIFISICCARAPLAKLNNKNANGMLLDVMSVFLYCPFGGASRKKSP
jgi:hypothetical protein